MVREIRGIRISYELSGLGSMVVFIHGIGMGLRQWDEQIRHLSVSHQCLAVDLRGHGSSSDGKITMDDFAADVIALLDDLGISQAHFVGYSMGGMVILEIFRIRSASVLSLTLSNTSCLTQMPNTEKNLSDRLSYIDSMTIDALGPVLASKCCDEDFPQSNPKAYDGFVTMLQRNRKEMYLESTVASASLDFRKILPGIHVPVLILAGERDRVCPVAASQLMHSLIPHSELVVFPSTGHLAPFERTIEYNETLEGFLLASDMFHEQKGIQDRPSGSGV